jgi:glycosyltransferase involved in cell wall biosynthesis
MAEIDLSTPGPDALKTRTILQVIPELETGGAERSTLEVADAIVKAGGRALVASQGGPLVEKLEASGAEHIALAVASKNPFTMWANKDALVKLIKAEKVDIIHVRSRAPAWSAYGAAKATNIPYITTYHGIYRANSPLKRVYNGVMAKGDYVIANSAHTREHVLLEHYPNRLKDDARLVTIHRGADLARFDPEKLDQSRIDAVFQSFGGRDAFRLLLPGRLTSWKGQRIAIEAARHLHEAGEMTRQGMPFRLVLAGGAQGRDAYEQALRGLIAEYGLEDMVAITGHLEDMPAGYRWADVVLSMSERPEAFGRIAIEAQAMGRMVVATNHGGARETVLDGETGALVPPSDGVAAANAIAALAALSPEQRAEREAKARQRAVSEFSITRMTDRTIAVYEKALGMKK